MAFSFARHLYIARAIKAASPFFFTLSACCAMDPSLVGNSNASGQNHDLSCRRLSLSPPSRPQPTITTREASNIISTGVAYLTFTCPPPKNSLDRPPLVLVGPQAPRRGEQQGTVAVAALAESCLAEVRPLCSELRKDVEEAAAGAMPLLQFGSDAKGEARVGPEHPHVDMIGSRCMNWESSAWVGGWWR